MGLGHDAHAGKLADFVDEDGSPLGQLAIAAYRNQMARFSADERAFYEIAVPPLEPAEARRLLHAGRWIDAAPGTVLAREGEPVPDLAFLVAGEVDIVVGSQVVGQCGPGSFVGEISVSTGGPASARTRASASVPATRASSSRALNGLIR